jgi:DNA-binding NarL/FixJ family response regulator
MHEGEQYVREALACGASGYVLKGAPQQELIDAIRAVDTGRTYLSSGLSEDLLEERQSEEASDDRYERLTQREREVLQLTAEGHTGPEVGEFLHISPRTVEKHRENIQKKLELKNVVEMAAYAFQRGLIPELPDLDDRGPDDEG